MRPITLSNHTELITSDGKKPSKTCLITLSASHTLLGGKQKRVGICETGCYLQFRLAARYVGSQRGPDLLLLQKHLGMVAEEEQNGPL